MVKRLAVLALLGLIIISQTALAGETKPIQLAVFNPIQMVPEQDSIFGVRLSLFYTVNRDMTGLSLVWLGVNRTTGDAGGVEIGLGNWVEGSAYGGQLGIINHAGKRFVGIQYGMVNVVEGNTSGVQWGLVNWTEGCLNGIQAGVVNFTRGNSIAGELGVVNWNEGSLQGAQFGFVNYAGHMKGLQLGIVNYTKSLDGLQIGLGNYNGNKDPMEFMVLANWSF